MKSLVPLLGAGGTFAGSVLAGFALGILADIRSGTQRYAFIGFFAGVAVGAYGAYRLLQRSL
jgi:hypothetical protein